MLLTFFIMGYSNRWYAKNTENYRFFWSHDQYNSQKSTKCANLGTLSSINTKNSTKPARNSFHFTVNGKGHFLRIMTSSKMMTSSKFWLIQNNPTIISHNPAKFLDMTNFGSKVTYGDKNIPPGLRSPKNPGWIGLS